MFTVDVRVHNNALRAALLVCKVKYLLSLKQNKRSEMWNEINLPVCSKLAGGRVLLTMNHSSLSYWSQVVIVGSLRGVIVWTQPCITKVTTH